MSQLDSFIQRVAHSLRGSQDKCDAILAELRGHLEDRTEALVAAGKAPEQAQRQAICEMGPVWLLGWRLSKAHGFSTIGQVLWEIWAGGIALEILPIPVILIIALESCKMIYKESGLGLFPGYWLWFISDLVILLSSGFLCSYALGRVVRGWAWVLLPCLATAGFSISGLISGAGLLNDGAVAGFLFAATIFIGARLGYRREKPHLGRMAWVGFGVMLAWTIIALPALLMISQHHGAHGYRDNFSSWSVTFGLIVGDFRRDIVQALQSFDAPFYILVVSLPWICGMLAWLLEYHRHYRLHSE
jgi:hypothetical protein